MEQLDWSHQSAYLNWDVLAKVPFLASSETTLSQSVNVFGKNGSLPISLGSGWLACSCGDGWGPLSPIYNDLAPCFLQGELFAAAGVIMILSGVFQVKELVQRKISSGNKVSWAFYAKLLLSALHIAFSVIIALTYEPTDIIRTGLVLNVAAGVVAFAIHYLEQFKSNISNGVLLFYWLFQALFGIAKFSSLKLRSELDSTYATVSLLATVNATLVLLLESWISPQPITSYGQELGVSPFDRANVFSRISFNWMAPLMKKGFYQYISEIDLPFLPKSLKSENTSASFYHYWNNQTSPSLVMALSKAFGAPFLLGGVFKALQDSLAFVQPQLLRLLIRFVNDYSQSVKDGEPLPLTKGLMIAGAMFVVSVTQTACLHQYFQRAFDFGMSIKSSLTSVVYDKSLVLSNETKQASNTGDIVNLMSVDVQRLQDLVQNLQIVWSGPFQIVLCLYSLHGLLGNSMWAGVFIMVIMIPLNAVIAKYQKKLQKTQMKFKDERSRLI
ncbi:hypothetical protein OXX80_009412, partial [Metschnikowia pulcherrima]